MQQNDQEEIQAQMFKHKKDQENIKSWLDIDNIIKKRAPNQVKTFPKELRDHLKKKHYVEPAPIQKMVLPYLLLEKTTERFVYIKSPTGTGKTLAFILPLLFFFDKDYLQNQYQQSEDAKLAYYPYGLILVSQHALLKQIRDDFDGATPDALKEMGFSNIQIKIQKKIRTNSQLMGMCLCGIPQTLLQLMQKKEINLKNMRYIVVDEADNTIMNDPNSYVLQIIQKLLTSGNFNYKIIVCGATIDMPSLKAHFIQKLAHQQNMNFYDFKYFDYQIELDNIYHFYHDQIKTKQQMVDFLAQVVIAETFDRCNDTQIMIFFNQKIDCTDIYSTLINDKNLKFLYDQDKICEIIQVQNREEQEKTIQQFRDKAKLIMLCSDLMGRGMNFRNVRLVVNYGVPRVSPYGRIDMRRYDQRVGRTGRMEDRGVALTIFKYVLMKNISPELQSNPDIQQESGILEEFKSKQMDVKKYESNAFIKQLIDVYKEQKELQAQNEINKQKIQQK
ncbi:hypothetical protein pb186bvf_013497 [Paramecium bursaria]